jgi:hypothetical protein
VVEMDREGVVESLVVVSGMKHRERVATSFGEVQLQRIGAGISEDGPCPAAGSAQLQPTDPTRPYR